MKKALLTVFAAIAMLFATPVWAAEMPVKAPPAPVAPPVIYDWSGFYGGVGAGWSRGSFDWTFLNPAPVTCCTAFSVSETDTVLSGIFGAQVQFGFFVIGAEATVSDFINNNFATNNLCNVLVPAVHCGVRLRDTDTFGGRGGFTWTNWLFYGEGGWARTAVNSRLSRVSPTATDPIADNFSVNKDGTYWGAGIDYMAGTFTHVAFIMGVEYQHINFGTETHFSSVDTFNLCPAAAFSCRSISAKEDIVRVRLTAKWNPFYP
jgi:outer membrane immunogenic protein